MTYLTSYGKSQSDFHCDWILSSTSSCTNLLLWVVANQNYPFLHSPSITTTTTTSSNTHHHHHQSPRLSQAYWQNSTSSPVNSRRGNSRRKRNCQGWWWWKGRRGIMSANMKHNRRETESVPMTQCQCMFLALPLNFKEKPNQRWLCIPTELQILIAGVTNTKSRHVEKSPLTQVLV